MTTNERLKSLEERVARSETSKSVLLVVVPDSSFHELKKTFTAYGGPTTEGMSGDLAQILQDALVTMCESEGSREGQPPWLD